METVGLHIRIDPYLGTFTQSEKQMADGTIVREEKIPAYKLFTDGIKNFESSNKNMLTKRHHYFFRKDWFKLENTNADITTWNNNWTYRSESVVNYSNE